MELKNNGSEKGSKNSKNSEKKKSGRLIANTVRVKSLSHQQIDVLWRWYSEYYEEISHSTFLTDLAAKTKVILLLDSGDKSIQGFSAIEIYFKTIAGKRVQVLYSGDTAINRAYWGQDVLPRHVVKEAFLAKLRHPFTPMYYFLLSMAYKTYLLLTKNFVNYWPRYDQEFPALEKELVGQLAFEKFPHAWKPERGLVSFEKCISKIKNDVGPVTPAELQFPAIRFFVGRNPGHATGDELCCLARVDFATAALLIKKQTRNFFWGRPKKSGRRPAAPVVSPVTSSLTVELTDRQVSL